MWIRIRDTLEENGIDTILANPYKTKIIAEAKIKSDKLDARILAANKRLVRHRISLVKNRTMLENKGHSLLDKYDYKSELADIFGKSGIISRH
jgi:transposase